MPMTKPSSRLATVALLAAVTMAVLVAAAFWPRPGGEPGGGVQVSGSGAARPVVGAPARDFTATTLEGKTVSLSTLRGRPVWLAFVATWCSSCRAEAPDVQAAYERAKASGAVVVAVCTCRRTPAPLGSISPGSGRPTCRSQTPTG